MIRSIIKIYKIGFAVAICLITGLANAQTTKVKGTVTDHKTGEKLPFVNVVFPGKKPVIAVSDNEGRFSIEGESETGTMTLTLVGYEALTLNLKRGREQTLNVKLKAISETLTTAVAVAKKPRYSNRNNPAVELVRKMIANKNNNRIEAHEYYKYEKYEKLELGLNDFISDSISSKRAYRRLRIVFNYLDSSAITGKQVLPVFFKESASSVYYRKSPESRKEHLHASRMVDLREIVDMESVEDYLTDIFGNVNLYDNEIMLFDNKYMGPLSPFAPHYYRFHIIDTVPVDEINCIRLALFPRNDGDFGFRGNLYVTADSVYAVKKVELSITPNASLNFVRNLMLTQNFKMIENTWCMANYDIDMELAYSKKDKRSILAQRRVSYRDYVFDDPEPNSIYKGLDRIIKMPDYDARSTEFWNLLRPTSLSQHEEDIFTMIDSVKRIPIVKATFRAIGIVTSGYVTFGKFDVGPIVSTASFNSLEGLRLRLGGQTNWNFDRHWYFSAYGAYGFKDREPKYEGKITYSFTKKKYYPWDYPINSLQASYSYDVKIPGQSFLYGSRDKIFLSFVRGEINKIMYERKFNLVWTKENPSGFSWAPNLALTTLYPRGAMNYENGRGERANSISYNEIGLLLRYAPNERFFQIMMGDRYPMNQTEPIIELGHKSGFAKLAGGQYSYSRTDATLYKRFWIGGFGYTDIWLKAGRLWNTAIPYPLLITPQANQAFAYQDEAYNMMNYMEFLIDKYACANLSYGFNGFIANRIPLIRKLKLREFITFKVFWGALDNKNHPNNNPDLFRFPVGSFPLNPEKPYMEASVALDNIFKVLRIDLIRRLGYFENPNIPMWSVRFRIRPSF